MNMRERMAKALFDDWVSEDFGNEYCSWELLLDKPTWLSRADTVLAAIEAAGMVIVPRVATEEMIAEGESAASVGIGKCNDDEALPRVWQAMINTTTAHDGGGK